MPNAPLPAEPPAKNHQGITARLVSRFGRALRGAVAGGIALTTRRRRAAPLSAAPAARDAATLRRPRQPRPAAPVPPAPPARRGWLARWFGRTRPRPASPARTKRRGSPSASTPDSWPGLSPEARAFFNTPVKDCDPNELRIVLALLARHIAEKAPAELGLDAKALFASLCGRLGTQLDPPQPDAAPPALENADSDAPIQAQGTAPAHDAKRPEGADPGSMPAAAAPAARASGSRRLSHRRRPPEPRRRAPTQRARRAVTQARPPRRLCYAACAGPP